MFHLRIRYDLRCPSRFGVDRAALYAAALEQCRWADRLGFESVALSEHHGVSDGYLPSPIVFGAAVAGSTRGLRIRMAALVAALHDPLRLAEDLAVLDLASGGRLDVLLTNGYVPSEFAMFGRKLSERARAVEEAVAVLDRAWSGERFEHRGRSVRVTPRPAQSPRPAIWLGGSSSAAARRAARIADGFAPSAPAYWNDYRDALRELGKPDPGPLPRSAGGAFLYIADDPDAAWTEIAPHALHEMNSYGRWAAASGADTGYAPVEDPDALRAQGLYRVVTPKECVELIERTGPDGSLTLHPLMGGLDPDFAWHSLTLFEHEVLPALDPALKPAPRP
jgi:alkanesulfonate monooxygenase SsuD/methylene tetrahydromethanopterin reductase-like flavin-dependent oxidoreductase (luciferase family)